MRATCASDTNQAQWPWATTHVAATLRPVLEKRWDDSGVESLLAAPMYPIVPYQWDRYVP